MTDSSHSWDTGAVLGQSGAHITVEERNGRRIVRKTSDSPRCATQEAKQRLAHDTVRAVSVPGVIDPWDGHSFTMEYVPGLPLGQFLQVGSLVECQGICASLAEFIDENWAHDGTVAAHDGLHEKLADLRTGTPHHDLLGSAAINALAAALPGMALPAGGNHGDLSFENVLVTPRDGRVWCIDFLDSPVETPLIDVGRLLVDADHGWWRTAHRAGGSETVGRRLLAAAIRGLCTRRGVTPREVAAMKVLAALRIRPYTVDPFRLAILNEVLMSETPLLGAD